MFLFICLFSTVNPLFKLKKESQFIFLQSFVTVQNGTILSILQIAKNYIPPI